MLKESIKVKETQTQRRASGFSQNNLSESATLLRAPELK